MQYKLLTVSGSEGACVSCNTPYRLTKVSSDRDHRENDIFEIMHTCRHINRPQVTRRFIEDVCLYIIEPVRARRLTLFKKWKNRQRGK